MICLKECLIKKIIIVYAQINFSINIFISQLLILEVIIITK